MNIEKINDEILKLTIEEESILCLLRSRENDDYLSTRLALVMEMRKRYYKKREALSEDNN